MSTKSKQQFVDAELSRQCADVTDGAYEYEPFGSDRGTLVMDKREAVYDWNPETDSYYKEPCILMRAI